MFDPISLFSRAGVGKSPVGAGLQLPRGSPRLSVAGLLPAQGHYVSARVKRIRHAWRQLSSTVPLSPHAKDNLLVGSRR